MCHEDAQASCCTRDEGGPFEVALEGAASNNQKLLRAKAVVVNVLVKRRGVITSCMDERDERKRTSDEASKHPLDDIKTGVPPVLREQHGGNLLTGHVMSGVQEA